MTTYVSEFARQTSKPKEQESKGFAFTAKYLALGAMAIGAPLGITGATLAVQPALVGDIYHAAIDKLTDQENRIGAALRTVLGKRVYVHCASLTGKSPHTLANTQRIGPKILPYIRLRPEVCDDVMKVADRQHQFPNDSDLNAIAWRVSVVAHEAEHYDKQERNESIVECYGIQQTAAVARALGASAAVADQLATSAAHQKPRDQEYIAASSCREGGKLDLDPATPGFFPSYVRTS